MEAPTRKRREAMPFLPIIRSTQYGTVGLGPKLPCGVSQSCKCLLKFLRSYHTFPLSHLWEVKTNPFPSETWPSGPVVIDVVLYRNICMYQLILHRAQVFWSHSNFPKVSEVKCRCSLSLIKLLAFVLVIFEDLNLVIGERPVKWLEVIYHIYFLLVVCLGNKHRRQGKQRVVYLLIQCWMRDVATMQRRLFHSFPFPAVVGLLSFPGVYT